MSAEQEITQERLVGASPDTHVEIETTGRVIRPALTLPSALVDELRVHARPEELWMQAVDPANVGMVELTIYAAAFDEYEVGEEFIVGLPLGTLESQLRAARMGTTTTDPVSLDLDSTRTRLEIQRDYSQTTLERVDGFLNIDPDAIREEPELPDLELGWTATMDAQALKDAIEHVNEIGDHVEVAERDGDVELSVLAGEKDDPDRAGQVTVTDAAERHLDDATEGVSSLFSLDYVLDMAKALVKAKVDAVTIEFGDEFPMRMSFERTNDDKDTLYEGEFFVAPRIQEGP